MVASTGMRCGEAVALPWRNVRLNEGNKQPFIRVDSARKRNGKIGKPKTKKGIRELFLADQLAELFRQMPRNGELVFPMPEFQDKKLGSGKTYAPKRLRAENEYRLMSVEEVCHNGLKITVDKNQIEWPGYNGRGAPRIKCLRHFAASKMIALGHDVVSVQRRLGHASAQTTLDIYSHLWERNKFQDEAQDMMRGLI
jgi:integrase